KLHVGFSLSYIFINKLIIREIKLEKASVNLHIYADSTNFTPFVRYFTSDPKKTYQDKKKKIKLDIEQVELVNNHFKLTNHKSTPHNRGVDFSDLDITEISGVFENVRLDTSAQADIRKLTLKEKSGFHIRELSTT